MLSFKFQYDNTLRKICENGEYYPLILFKFQYDNTLRMFGAGLWGKKNIFKFQYDNTLRRGYKSYSDIILFLLSFVNLNLLLKNKKFKYF